MALSITNIYKIAPLNNLKNQGYLVLAQSTSI